MAGPADPSDVELTGTLERVVFHNPDTQYSVLHVETETGRRETVVGDFYKPVEGQRLRIRARAIEHKKYGRQLAASSYEEILPSTREGLVHYLSSRFVKGIGPRFAGAIVDAFGDDTIAVLDRDPDRLREVKGIGEKRLAQIVAAWRDSRHMSELMMFLGAHDVGPGLAMRIYQHYGGESIARIQADPYQLAMDVDRIGFRTADLIARRLGIAQDAPRRLQAGLLYVLHYQTQAAGHCCLPHDELIDLARRELALPDTPAIEAQLDALVASGDLVRDADVSGAPIYLPLFHGAEREVARLTLELAIAPALESRRRHARVEAGPVALTDQQIGALEMALASRVSVITGGPGVGKTTLVRQLVATAHRLGMEVALGAPTGRAAKRLAEATGREATTIHRMLGYGRRFLDEDGTEDDEDEGQIKADLVVIDETSMVDLMLMRELLRAIPPYASLVLVGDADQLPSVGPGNVLADLIASKRFPVAHLDFVFRQAAGSRIVEIAHEVNAGRLPPLGAPDPDSLGDFYFVRADEPPRCAELVLRLVTERIPRRFGFDPMRDVQVITPMHKGEVGTIAMNEALRAALNPQGAPIEIGGKTFRTGDKVMQVKNNHNLEIYNGDIGFVKDHIPADDLLEVMFDDRRVRLASDELEDLQLAYCITVHKSQGSEYPAVVLPLLSQHHVMLQRNLLYTALTRGKKLVVVVGTERALARAVSSGAGRARHSRLAERLAGSRLGDW